MIIALPPTTLVNRIVPKDRFKFTDATKINRIRCGWQNLPPTHLTYLHRIY